MENNKTKVSFSREIAHFVDSMEQRGTPEYRLLRRYANRLTRNHPAVLHQFEYGYMNARTNIELLQAFTLANLRINRRKLPEKDEVDIQMDYFFDNYKPAVIHLIDSIDGSDRTFGSPQNALHLAKFMITIDALERFNDNYELLETEEQILPLYRDY